MRDEKIRDDVRSQTTLKATKLATVSILTALGVGFSFFPGPIPVGPTLVFPFQSMINVIAGILVGPWYAGAVALAVGVIRIFLHTGTVFSLPGGIPGAILVGVTYRLTKSYLSAFAEIPGTALVGAFLSAFLIAPMIGSNATLLFFVAAFTPPAVLGSVIGYIVMIALRKRGTIARIPS
ncbi:MAG TPA: energy coupling factor transporter S component ThiW [Candidatus Dormibacteraeota bacterium]|jgi:energy coupling factor transporter S component ThiW|nr:energy coupling factor transporter S component ThiW [Candidatus Dormibacteraeota bacterium]